MSISPLTLLGNGMGQGESLFGTLGQSSFGAGGFGGLLGVLLGGSSADAGASAEGGSGTFDFLTALLGGNSAEGAEDLFSFLQGASVNLAEFAANAETEVDIDSTAMTALLEKMDALADKLGALISAGEGAGETLLTSVTYTEVEVVVQQMVVEFEAVGLEVSDISNMKSLASIFESLGMDPEEAMERAVGYVALMKYAQVEQEKQKEIQLLKAMLEGEDPMAAYQAYMAGEGSASSAESVLAQSSTLRWSYGKATTTTIISRAELTHSALVGGELPLAAQQGKGVADVMQSMSPEDWDALAASDRPLAEKVSIALKQAGIIEGESGAFAAAARAASARLKKSPGNASAESDVISGADAQVRGEYIKPQPLADVLSQSRQVFSVNGSTNGMVQVQAENAEPMDVNDSVDLDSFIEKQIQNQNRPAGMERMAQMSRQADVSAQMQMQVRQLAQKGGGEVKMVLNPPELGELDIHIRVSDGRVSGVIASQNMDVLEQMARDLRYLQEALAEAGLDFAEDGLSFQLKDDGTGSGEGGQDSFFAEGETQETGEHDEDEVLADVQSSRWIDPDKLVDMDA